MRTINEIEDEIDSPVPTVNADKVMDFVNEHGSSHDKMAYAIIDGDLERVIAIEKLGIECIDRQFIKLAIKHNRQFIVHHQVKKGASLDEVIDISRDYENISILSWAKYTKRNTMGGKK